MAEAVLICPGKMAWDWTQSYLVCDACGFRVSRKAILDVEAGGYSAITTHSLPGETEEPERG